MKFTKYIAIAFAISSFYMPHSSCATYSIETGLDELECSAKVLRKSDTKELLGSFNPYHKVSHGEVYHDTETELAIMAGKKTEADVLNHYIYGTGTNLRIDRFTDIDRKLHPVIFKFKNHSKIKKYKVNINELLLPIEIQNSLISAEDLAEFLYPNMIKALSGNLALGITTSSICALMTLPIILFYIPLFMEVLDHGATLSDFAFPVAFVGGLASIFAVPAIALIVLSIKSGKDLSQAKKVYKNLLEKAAFHYKKSKGKDFKINYKKHKETIKIKPGRTTELLFFSLDKNLFNDTPVTLNIKTKA